jgi:CRP/FNR family cyclic AMP-dependent transcriptional regulator
MNEQAIPLLRNVALFSRCSDYELALVAKRATLREVSKDAPVVVKGEPGNEMFLLLSGAAAASSEGRLEREFTTGEYFGELAALLPAPRATDVIATADSLFAVLATNEVYSLVDTIPGVARKMLEGLAANMRAELTHH